MTSIHIASEQEIVDAMKLIQKRLRIVMEPSSAVPLATILKNQEVFAGKRVGAIVTGGNVDIDKLPCPDRCSAARDGEIGEEPGRHSDRGF